MSAWIEGFIESYGALALSVGTALEGDAMVITGGIIAHRELMPFWTAVLAAAAGGYTSDLVLYGVGRRYRDAPRVRRVLEHDALQGVVDRLSRNIVLFALLFRFVPGMRTFGPFSLAAVRMPFGSYALCTGISSLLWGLSGVTLGYYLGNAVEALFGRFHRLEVALLAPTLVAAVVGLGLYLRHRKR